MIRTILQSLCLAIGFCSIQQTSAQANKKTTQLIAAWKQNPCGKQIFVIEQASTNDDENEKTEIYGLLSWDLEKNIWLFEYANEKFAWEIRNNHMYQKAQDGSQKKYPCTGIAMFLQHQIDEWPNLLQVQDEKHYDNIYMLIATYNKKPIIFRYMINPFALLELAFEDPSSGNYIAIKFMLPNYDEIKQQHIN